jgi:prepilin-type N-terminal cleavage/methylation domain-containing protein
MSTSERADRARGFSMIELLVTVVLAGIIFAAMVPLFANALKRTSGDNLRVTATNIAQDRIEKVRQLPYDQITADAAHPTTSPNLYNPAFEGFGPTQLVGGKTFTVAYSVSPYPSYKKVIVTVDWAGSGPNYTTTMKTIVMDPTAISARSTSNPYPTPTSGYTLTVTFKDARQVISPGVTVSYKIGTTTYNPASTQTQTFPFPSKTYALTWTGLPGGVTIPYTVKCKSQYNTTSTPFWIAPTFHMLTNGWIKFDTNPGGS